LGARNLALKLHALEGKMSERRGSRRSKSFLRGFVYVSRKRGALACLVRDLSDKGARIIFSDQVTLPDMVELYIPQRDQTLRARVHWRKNDEIGLAFTETERVPDAQPSAADIAQRVALLEAELVSLRSLLKRMKAEQADSSVKELVA
jgi:hypothetical protein